MYGFQLLLHKRQTFGHRHMKVFLDVLNLVANLTYQYLHLNVYYFISRIWMQEFIERIQDQIGVRKSQGESQLLQSEQYSYLTAFVNMYYVFSSVFISTSRNLDRIFFYSYGSYGLFRCPSLVPTSIIFFWPSCPSTAV